MSNQATILQYEIIPNLRINLEIVEAFFKYLPYEKIGELKYSLTYFYQDTIQFSSVMEIIFEIEKCIQYQASEKGAVEIPAGIVFEQYVIINGKKFDFFYHGQLIILNTSACIFWNWYQSTPSVELQLKDTISPNKILSLLENFHTAINDIKSKND